MSKKVKQIELRLKEMEYEKHALEQELKLKERELIQERERREREREQHELKIAQVAADKELELRRLELEMNKNLKSGNSNSGQDRAGNYRSPRAPEFYFSSFNENTDDLDTWFTMFELQCDIFEVSDNDRKAHLIGLFSGKYRDALISFAGSEYTTIRDKMLRTFNLTPDGYRRKLFGLIPDEDETIHTFRIRLQFCFDKWISLVKIKKDYESLKDLIIYHQILESCNPDFTKFLLLHNVISTEEIADKADDFFQAYPNQQLARSRGKYLNSNAAGNNQTLENKGKGIFRGQYRFGGVPGRGDSVFGRGTGKKYDISDQSDKFIQCFYCRELGHRVADCPK